MTDKEYKAMLCVVSHKESFAKIMALFSGEITFRAATHDNSKLTEEEFNAYASVVDEFNKYEFNSKEELELRKKLHGGASVHRKRNRHHPEHFENGLDDMNLIDVLEMLCDWKSASTRSPSDSIRKSLPILRDKYNISPQLLKIIENTLRDFNMYS